MPERGRPLPDGYRIDVFADQELVSGADVVALWRDEAALSSQEAERRLSELLLVATDGPGRPAAICTAFLQRNDQLQAMMWHGRMFVSAAHRRAGLSIAMGIAAREHLGERFAAGEDQRGIGMLWEVETDVYKRRATGSGYNAAAAIWPSDFVFIGENARGDHVRVHYFPGALAPEPDQGRL